MKNGGGNVGELVDGGPKHIFVGGKGGVGKTTCSVALALQLGSRGHRTLLMSSDPAHNLGDALKMTLRPGQETQLENSLVTVLEVDPKTELAMESIGEEFAQIKAFLSSLPGIDEAVALSTLAERSAKYDRVVIDTAPTGHTLRLLQLPQLLTETINRLSQWDTTIAGVWSYFSTGEDATTKIKAKLEEYRAKVEMLTRLLVDQRQTTFVCVCIAEHLSVFETARLARSLREQHVDCRFVLINQLLPVAFQNMVASLQGGVPIPEMVSRAASLCGARARIQAGYVWQLEQAMTAIRATVVRLPIEEAEIRGEEALLRFGQLMMQPRAELYGGQQGEGDAVSLQQLQQTLGVEAVKKAVVIDPVAAVMKLLGKPNGIAQLCQHSAVREARAASPTMQTFFAILEQGPQGLMMAYMTLSTNPALKQELTELLPKVQDLLE
jgi:arsenite-transporting ATPase